MTHEYEVTGMSCAHCVVRVQKALEKHPDIEKAEVTLDPAKATIKMKKHVDTPELDKLLAEAGAYHIQETVR